MLMDRYLGDEVRMLSGERESLPPPWTVHQRQHGYVEGERGGGIRDGVRRLRSVLEALARG
jgi:hypothetical protein